MNLRCCHPALVCLLACVLFVSSHWPVNADEGWQKQVLHEKFFAEGASAGDINGDGHVDLVAGPLWFAGPDFQESKLLAEAREFSIFTYSDQFFSQVFDANGDQANDVLVLGFPGKSARLYLNPGHDALDSTWEMHDVASIVDNESPFIADLIPGGLPEIVCGREGQYGYYQAGPEPTTSWKWIPISRPGACGGRFTHSMGVGDVNGDGRLDVLDRTFWWEQPAESATDAIWTKHQWAPENYGGGGAQICVSDIDADGDNDIVTSYNAHGYGLGWFEQGEDGSFTQHRLMGTNSLENDYGVVFSQLHALAIRDVDDDGRPDIVTGKRYWAHQGHDPGGLRQPVLYWFRNLENPEAEGGVDFVPYEIDSDSGVGVDVLVTDLNADQRLDVVTCSKRGLMVHRQLPNELLASTPDKWKVEEGRDQNQYADGFSPEEAAQNMLVPAGFEVDLLAAEPELTQPIAMCFDARGRIWVVEGHTYPQKAPEGEGRDRVVILSDEDSDGSFETKKTFIEGLNLVSGIEVGFGGVWIGAAPELLFIPDRDQDDVPDAEPQVLLDGWGYEDTHETLNSFTWGPDGWLYGCHGVFTHSRVGKPGTPDAHREPLNAGVWRYHPVEHRFEVFAHGTSNPWGVDFNDQGDWFVTACVIPHLYHIQQGARYQRQAGQHFNAYTYNDIKTIADHSHFTGKIQEHAFWGSKPIAPLGTSMVGGGHAHCGLAIYNGESFPPQYRNSLLFHNLHGHRIVREKVEIEGSGYVGLHRPDFALSQDHKQIGVGAMVGPDGSLYCSDWHDVQTCHNRSPEIWDRTDGRLFRIRYGAVQPQQFDLWQESDLQLTGRLSGNGFFARAAQRVLHERAASGKLDLTVVVPKLDSLLAGEDQRLRLRALWTKYCIGALSEIDLQTY